MARFREPTIEDVYEMISNAVSNHVYGWAGIRHLTPETEDPDWRNASVEQSDGTLLLQLPLAGKRFRIRVEEE